MSFQNIRPLHILWQDGVTEEMLAGVLRGITRILTLAGVSQEFEVVRLDQRRHSSWFSPIRKCPRKNKSLDWHIWQARKNTKVPNHLNSTALLDSLTNDPAHKKEPRYELVVVNELLHWSNDSSRPVGGAARPGVGTVITLYGYLQNARPTPWETEADKIKKWPAYLFGTEKIAMHELGHVFGLCTGTCPINPTDEEIKNAHCLNKCVMSWEIAVWNQLTDDQPFCPTCLEKLKQFFIKP